MSSDDSDKLEMFCAEQKSKVRKRYMTKRELDNLDTMDDFIADSDSDIPYESDEESERSQLSEVESDEISKISDAKASDDKVIEKDSSCSLFSNLSVSDIEEKTDETKSLNSKKRLIRHESESSLDNCESKKKILNEFAYKCTKTDKVNQHFSSNIYTHFNESSSHLNNFSKSPVIEKLLLYIKENVEIQIDINKRFHTLKIISEIFSPKPRKYFHCNYNDNKKIFIMNLITSILNNHNASTDKYFWRRNFQQLHFISSLLNVVNDEMKDFEAKNFIKTYTTTKEELLSKIYNICNESVFANNLPQKINIKWYPKLNKTAGRCVLSYDIENPSVHLIEIHLSSEIVTDAERLLKTLVHEMCHGAVWIINKRNGHHGSLWKMWTHKVERIFPLLSVSSPYHCYDIQHTSCHSQVREASEESGQRVLYADGGKKLVSDNDREMLLGLSGLVDEIYVDDIGLSDTFMSLDSL